MIISCLRPVLRQLTAGVFLLLLRVPMLYAQQKQTLRDCVVQWSDTSLVLENSRISRAFSRQNGNLLTRALTDRQRGRTWTINNTTPDDAYPGLSDQTGASTVEVSRQPANNLTPAHLRATVTTHYPGLDVRRVFRLYPNCPAIACDVYYRGEARALPALTGADGQPNTPGNGTGEGAKDKRNGSFPTMSNLRLPGRHWRFTAVRFTDATDVNNTLVQTTDVLGYRSPVSLAGNLLFADDQAGGGGIFLLKESPAPTAQVAYPGVDFQVSFDALRVAGIGLDGGDLNALTADWTRGYGVVTGVYGPGEREKLCALRTYQKQIRRHQPDRDEMIMMNTWGDRNRDASVGEAFLMKELRAGAELGITYLQIDDGWQQGISKNSASTAGASTPGASTAGASTPGASTAGRLWDEWDAASWQPNAGRFPNGLAPVVAQARKLGIQLGLWFHPSNADSYARWQTDADIVVGLYRQFGIRTFKIDGIQLPDKRAETNLRHFFDAVVAATNGAVVFNVDATAGRRMGYHFMNQYGNIFLENRYTDFTNYYPYWTLRNLWMLARYVPAENLQIEFLNKWRNADKYPQDDSFAPARVPFDYTFAIAMMGQPLAWFEASGLPPEAFALAPLVNAYRSVQADLHAGCILPIGEEPSGRGWTGFQSIRDGDGSNAGYLLVFRELNQQPTQKIKTWLPAGRAVELTSVLGAGSSFKATTDVEGKLEFGLPTAHSFALYRYVVR